jgi:site-specific DNA-cytosine methylase
LSKVCARHFGVDLVVEHKFSCEQEAWKRTWIQGHFAPELLFEQVEAMGASHATDVISGEIAEIPEVDIAIGGFECDSVSSLNCNGKEFRGQCVELGTGRTGRTARAVLSYAAKHRPLVLILENVVAFGSAGLKDVGLMVGMLEALGYLATRAEYDSKHFGVAQARMRLYIIVVLHAATTRSRRIARLSGSNRSLALCGP